MKKEIIMILFILGFVVVGHVFTQNYEKNFLTEIEGDLNDLREKLLSSNESTEKNFEINENLKNDIDEIKEKWERKYNKLAYYIEHDELEKIETQMVLMSGYIELKQYDYCVIELDKCVFLIEHVRDKDSFQLVNMF